MRFSRSTLKIVIIVSFAMAVLGGFLLWKPELNRGINAEGIRTFGALIFFFFSVDYLLTDQNFFKSKYYRILLLALSLFMITVTLNFAHLLPQLTEILYPTSIALMAMSFAAWAFDKPDVKVLQALKAGFCLLVAGAVVLGSFGLEYSKLAWQMAFGLCVLANIIQFRNDWLEQRNVSKSDH